MRFQYKLALSIFAVGAIAVVIGARVQYLDARRAELANHAHLLTETARELARNLDEMLLAEARVLQTLADAPVAREALRASNRRFDGLDEAARSTALAQLDARWRRASGPDDPFVRSRMQNALADYLGAHEARHPGEYGEIFITDRHGGTVATTARLTDFYQADEYHWQAAYHAGKGRIFFDDRGFDQSAERYVLGVVVPIMEGDAVLGLLKANLAVGGPLRQFIDDLGETGGPQVELIRSRGRVILGQASAPFSEQVGPEVVAAMDRSAPGAVPITPGAKRLIAYAPVGLTVDGADIGFGGREQSDEQWGGNASEPWFLVVSDGVEAALAPASERTRELLGIAGALLVLMALAALALGYRLAGPVRQLRAMTRRVGAGDLEARVAPKTRDELGRLAEDFNAMVEGLRAVTASRDELMAEVARREEVEERLRGRERDLQLLVQDLGNSNRALEEFAYMASHDLREPLITITAFGDLLEQECGHHLTPDGQDHLQRMRKAAVRLRCLVDDLRTYSQVNTGDREFAPVDLNRLVAEVIDDLRGRIDAAGARITVGTLPRIEADEPRLRQLFLNLLSNAVKYRHPEVHPEVTVEARPAEGPALEISVEDNGIGFEPQYAEQILEPFERLHTHRHYEGSGLGLAICRRIVEQHGGSLRAQGVPNHGATFYITLPVTQGAVGGKAA